jgi:transcriptional regulator with XRE-family HTH domain
VKYKEVIIKEDPYILQGVNISKLAREMGCDRSYLSQVKNGKEIATVDFYRRIREKLFKK